MSLTKTFYHEEIVKAMEEEHGINCDCDECIEDMSKDYTIQQEDYDREKEYEILCTRCIQPIFRGETVFKLENGVQIHSGCMTRQEANLE